MGQILTIQDELIIENCITCGVRFAMPLTLHQRLQSIGDRQSFYCPNGHSMVFKYSQTEQENRKLKEEAGYLRNAQAELHSQLTEKEESIRKLNHQIATRNKRLKAGVCPCCNRTFKELVAHMESKHSDYSQPLAKPNKLHTKINAKLTPKP